MITFANVEQMKLFNNIRNQVRYDIDMIVWNELSENVIDNVFNNVKKQWNEDKE